MLSYQFLHFPLVQEMQAGGGDSGDENWSMRGDTMDCGYLPWKQQFN